MERNDRKERDEVLLAGGEREDCNALVLQNEEEVAERRKPDSAVGVSLSGRIEADALRQERPVLDGKDRERRVVGGEREPARGLEIDAEAAAGRGPAQREAREQRKSAGVLDFEQEQPAFRHRDEQESVVLGVEGDLEDGSVQGNQRVQVAERLARLAVRRAVLVVAVRALTVLRK